MQLRFCGGRLRAVALLLLMQEIEGDRALVVGVKELCALVGELGEAPLLPCDVLLSLLAQDGSRFRQAKR
jgi:hypothetical protein